MAFRHAMLLAMLALAITPALSAGRGLFQIIGSTNAVGRSEAIIRDDYSGTSSVGQIDVDERSGSSQAAKYARGATRAGAQTQLAIAIQAETGGAGGASAAADLIKQTAGYRGSSIAGDIFSDTRSGGSSPAEDAIRRSQADNAAVQERINGMMARDDRPFDI